MIWCEHCRDHYAEDHYDEVGHKVGLAYGSTGRQMGVERAAQALIRDDVGSPTWYESYKILRQFVEASPS